MYIKFTNIDYSMQDSYYQFQMSATYQNTTNSTSGDLLQPIPVYTITMPVHRLEIKLLDGHYVPVQGTVTVNGRRVITDSTGIALFSLADGNYEVVGEYLGGTRSLNLDLTDDASRMLVFRVLNPVVTVIDDNGKPLSAKVTLGNYTAQTDNTGNARFPQTTIQETNATIQYGDLTVVRYLVFDDSDNAKAILDLNAPIISDLNATYTKGYVTLSATITDPGEYATGFGNSSEFVVNYTIGTNKRRTYMYPLSASRFQAEIPIIDPAQTVYYTLSASDVSGNVKSVSGSFTPEAPQQPIGGNTNGTGTTGGSQGTDMGQYAIYAVIGIIVLALIVFMMKKKSEDEG